MNCVPLFVMMEFGTPKAMEHVKEEQHGLLELDHGDRSSLYPLCKLVYGDKQVCISPERPLEGSNQIEPLDHERPHDGDRLECLVGR